MIKQNTIYIDSVSWIELVESLNRKYTSDLKQLEQYEKQFIIDGGNYLRTAKTIANRDLKKLTNKQLAEIYQDYQDKLFLYSIFAWTSFILNNYVAERATTILANYIKKHKRGNERQLFIDSLFKPTKKAAVLELQEEVDKHNGKLSNTVFENLFNKFKWLSCLDIHNKPWMKE